MSANESGGSGRVIAGRYRLLGPLGRGGMGVVWRARDEVLAREVAVKEVRAPGGMDAAEVARLYRRLEREAWAAARVSHRGVVTVYDVVTEEGRPWIVMELVRGLSLAEVLEGEGPMTPQRTAHLGEQVLAALRSAHGAGVLHRDVKPANVLVANDGRVVLSDFGIASLAGVSPLTMPGEVIGSPEYLAPERALGQDPGPESDLWSLGVMLYTAVEGVSPFLRDSPVATLEAVVDAELPPPRRAGPLEPVLEGLLRKDPAERLPAAEAARMLRIIGAGGAVRDPGGPAWDPAAATAVQAGPYGGDRGTTPVPSAPLPVQPPERSGSGAGLVLALGIVALLAVLALLVWLLLRDTGGGDGAHGPSGTPGVTERPSPSAPASASPSEAATSGPAQNVTLYVHTLRGAYAGSCPPPATGTPSFTGTIEVAVTPAVVEYRWARLDGSTSAEPWRSITYEAGGARTRQLNHDESGSTAGGNVQDAVRLEVRTPLLKTSPWLEFSVACTEETPTDGASSPGPASPSGPPAGTTAPTAGPAPTGSPAADPQALPLNTGR
ncbi:serine/threonine-protein kinase [Streptomyces racemochromogenes]|uniref:non-specific serine/threonine protein kinase n=1 Tax=Streptomyces racemochromogenes TaxID=67353 RepID=A0ABW7PDM3_9ACTN